MNFSDYSALRPDLLSRKVSSVSLVENHLQKIGSEAILNALLSHNAENALARAREVDAKIQSGRAGKLAGMVVGVKDNICVKGQPCTCGSKILGNFIAPYSATVIEKLLAEDAILLGKLNLDEFAMGSSTENSAFGRVLHPLDHSRVPGGSSGGSAVAVKAGLMTSSLGSDTGGSIRQPAALTGVVGLKPTYGRVSRYGLVAFASSLDVIGPFTHSVADSALMLEVLAGRDERDSTTADMPVPPYTASLGKKIDGLRIGVPKEYLSESLDREIREAFLKRMEALRAGGASVSEISLPHTEYTIATYYILATAEASSNLARFDGARYGFRSEHSSTLDEMYRNSRTEGFGPEVKRRIMLGTYVLSSGYYDAYYRKAQKVRRLIKQDFDSAFSSVDVILTPTTPTTAFKAGEKILDPLQMYLSDIYTVSANLAGIPGLSLPAGTDAQGLPIGIQIMARHFDEETIFRTAAFLEKVQ